LVADAKAVGNWELSGGIMLVTHPPAMLTTPVMWRFVTPRASVKEISMAPRKSPAKMTHLARWAAALLLLFGVGPVQAEEIVHFDGAAARRSPAGVVACPGAYHGFDAPSNPRRELPDYRTRDGVVPIAGTDPAARGDALLRVPAFLDRYLRD
jgi:dienelactone hydrolase